MQVQSKIQPDALNKRKKVVLRFGKVKIIQISSLKEQNLRYWIKKDVLVHAGMQALRTA